MPADNTPHIPIRTVQQKVTNLLEYCVSGKPAGIFTFNLDLLMNPVVNGCFQREITSNFRPDSDYCFDFSGVRYIEESALKGIKVFNDMHKVHRKKPVSFCSVRGLDLELDLLDSLAYLGPVVKYAGRKEFLESF